MHKGSIHRVCGRHKRFLVISGMLVYLWLTYIRYVYIPTGASGLFPLRFPSFSLSGCDPRAEVARDPRPKKNRTSAIYQRSRSRGARRDRSEAHSACAYMLPMTRSECDASRHNNECIAADDSLLALI